MRAEAILLVAEQLAAVNGLLASVPIEPGWTTPPSVTVVDAVTHPWVARGTIDRRKVADGPWLLVGAGAEVFGAARPEDQVQRPTVDVVVRYACAGNDQRTLAHLTRFESTTLRAALRAVQLPWRGDEDVLERNGVEFDAPSWRWLDPLDSPGDDVLSSALVLSFGVTDPWALGTIS